MTCWAIWTKRNKLMVVEMVRPLNRVADSAQKHPQEFHSFCPIYPPEESLKEEASMKATESKSH